MAKIKASKTEYVAAMLPHTRKEVFWDVLKMHWKDLLSGGFVILLFSLPLHFFAIYEDIARAGLQQKLENASAEQQQQILYQMLSLNNTRALWDVLGFLILALGISGMIRVIRQYAWEENVYFAADFPRGIRQNGKQTLALGLLVGVFHALTVYACNLAAVTPSKAMAVILMLPVCAVIFLGIPAAGYALVAISLYENAFIRNLKLGLAMTAKTAGKTLLVLLCCMAPYAVQWIPNMYCHVIGRIIGSLLIPFVMLGWYLFTLEQYDRLVNRDRFPELVGKGTFPCEIEK